MATLDDLNAQLELLKAALRSGVLRVKHKDIETLFRSAADIQIAMASIKAEIREINKAPRKPKYIREQENEFKKPDGGY